jgi:hypothetical protein
LALALDRARGGALDLDREGIEHIGTFRPPSTDTIFTIANGLSFVNLCE